MMAAIQASGGRSRVMLLEDMDTCGKKLLMTGNGRCNFSNRNADQAENYRSFRSDDRAISDFVGRVCRVFSPADTVAFFENLGVAARYRDSCLYPASFQASAIRNALERKAERNGVKIRRNTGVSSIRKKDGVFLIGTEGWEYRAEKIILCTGSRASLPERTRDHAADLLREAEKLGLSVSSFLPSLTGLVCKKDGFEKCSGDRTLGKLSLRTGKHVHSEEGEIQWTQQGISGIAVFNLSHFAAEAAARSEDCEISVDFCPDIPEEKLSLLLESDPSAQGILPARMAAHLNALAGRKAGEGRTPQSRVQILCGLIKNYTLPVLGTEGIERAQVCCGGISTDEFTPETMEAKKIPGFYAAGEIVDIDGRCGGFNLQWAWSSGAAAGMAAGGRQT